MLSQNNINGFEDSEKDLRVGIWIPKSFNSFDTLVNLIKQQDVISSCDSEIFINNDDNLISEDVYKLLCKLNNVCLLSTNFPYFSRIDVSSSKKSTDSDFSEVKSIDISPIRFFSPTTSPKSELCSQVDEFQSIMGVASVFIVLSKEDLKSKNVEFIKIYISEIIESFKLYYQETKFILVMHGIRDLVLGNTTNTGNSGEKINGIQVDDSAFFKISVINELTSYLLVYHNVDTIETDDYSDLANVITLASKSIRSSYSKRSSSKFKSKPGQSIREETEMLNKTWLSQLTQIPNVGRNEATAISQKYNKPSEIIESILNSREEFSNEVKSIPVDIKKKRTVGKSISNRLATLYSYTLVPDDLL